MKKLIVVADWADDSLTCQEFRSAVEGFAKDPHEVTISFVSSTPSTIHTSFLLSQISFTENRYGRPLDTVIFQNTDPRLQSMEGVEGAKGAEFTVARLASGTYVCGPNAGYDFSMIKDSIQKFYIYRNVDSGSQFRSRDLYGRICAHLMDTMQDEMDLEEISRDYIPEFMDVHIGHIDNYGNIKTTATESYLKGDYKIGDTIPITINNVTLEAIYVDNLFAATPGELVIYPGSSGNPDDRFLEITMWRHFTEEHPTTGIHAFHQPRPGMKVVIKK